MAGSKNNQKINLELDRKNSQVNLNEPSNDVYTSEIEKAQLMIEELRTKKEQQEREAERKQHIQGKRDEFSNFRAEVLDKLTDALPKIDQELNGAKEEISDLESAKKHFLGNLETVKNINPEHWKDSEVLVKLDKFQALLSKAAKDYDQFSSILSQGRGNGGRSIKKTAQLTLAPISGFWGDFVRGFAFSLPLIIALAILFSIFSTNG